MSFLSVEKRINFGRETIIPMIKVYTLLQVLIRMNSNIILSEYGESIRSTFKVNSNNPNSLPVLICARNEEEKLPKLLYSLAMQTYPVQPIIIDNASTDSTAKVAEDLGCIVIEETKPGLIFALKKGFSYFNDNNETRPILLTDADTIPVNTWAEKLQNQSNRLFDSNGGQLFGPVFYYGRSLIGLMKTIYFSHYKDRVAYKNKFIKARGPNAILIPDDKQKILESLACKMDESVVTGTDELVKDTVADSGGSLDRTWDVSATVFSSYDRPILLKAFIKAILSAGDFSRDQYQDWYQSRPNGIKYIAHKQNV